METIEQLKANRKYHYIIVVNGVEIRQEIESMTRALKLCRMLQEQHKHDTIQLKAIKIK